ncbi:hypothetical protein B0T24DRAFT_221936 [Lasiosphaeria ovina]|uniref:Uncharacterized protein n=1 Tax=Lasiosphaeria ovina TaxID=92902 RepID=A0AAE0NAS2_9PEZI|nr:hypothetical protein B0T24DRAFT_221936 [Lasiosphaeria ovina]
MDTSTHANQSGAATRKAFAKTSGLSRTAHKNRNLTLAPGEGRQAIIDRIKSFQRQLPKFHRHLGLASHEARHPRGRGKEEGRAGLTRPCCTVLSAHSQRQSGVTEAEEKKQTETSLSPSKEIVKVGDGSCEGTLAVAIVVDLGGLRAWLHALSCDILSLLALSLDRKNERSDWPPSSKFLSSAVVARANAHAVAPRRSLRWAWQVGVMPDHTCS